VKGILLDIDSPGGEAGGVFDLADKIFAARKVKPIWAVANDEAFSAAYAIAAAADKIYLSRTGGVGSVGVIAVHLDQSMAEADAGLKYTAVFAGEHKNDLSPHEPLSDPARAQLQAEVDRVYALFTESVARMRGLDLAAVKATEAALYFGEQSLAVGLADRIGTMGDALSDLTKKIARPSTTTIRRMERKENPMTENTQPVDWTWIPEWSPCPISRP
jgi:signal peptide peptidase SppA